MSKKKHTSKKRSRPLVDPPHKIGGKPPVMDRPPQLAPGEVDLATLPEFQLVAMLNGEYQNVLRSKDNITSINAEFMKRFKPQQAQPAQPQQPEKPKSPIDVKETIIKKE